MAATGILRKVRKEFDYDGYVSAFFSVKHSPNGELRINCPNCMDSKYKCYVNDEKKYFNCFKCDFNSGNYDVFDFVAISEGITRGQSMMRLTREYAEPAKSWQEIIDNVQAVEVEEDDFITTHLAYLDGFPDGAVPMTLETREKHKRFWDYLNTRGFTDQDILDIKTHCVPEMSVYMYDQNKRCRGNIGNRIILPVYGGAHKLVSWLARSIDGKEPKYLNAPDSDMSKTLWPYVNALDGKVVLVEGIIDALAVRRVGFAAYATFGKKVSHGQIALLKSWGIHSVVLFWDKKDAKKEMLRSIELLKMHFNTVKVPDFSEWPKDKDSGDTLNWEEGAAQMQNMLDNRLVDVNSMEFALWKID